MHHCETLQEPASSAANRVFRLLGLQVCRCCNIHSSTTYKVTVAVDGWDEVASNACEMHVARPMGSIHADLVESEVLSSGSCSPSRALGSTHECPKWVAGLTGRSRTWWLVCSFKRASFDFLYAEQQARSGWKEAGFYSNLACYWINRSARASCIKLNKYDPSRRDFVSSQAPPKPFPSPTFLPFQSSHRASATIALLMTIIGRIIQSSLPHKLASFAAFCC